MIIIYTYICPRFRTVGYVVFMYLTYFLEDSHTQIAALPKQIYCEK